MCGLGLCFVYCLVGYVVGVGLVLCDGLGRYCCDVLGVGFYVYLLECYVVVEYSYFLLCFGGV